MPTPIGAAELVKKIKEASANNNIRPPQNPEKRLGTVSTDFVRSAFNITVPVAFDGEDIYRNIDVYTEVPFPGDRVIAEKFGNSWAVTGTKQVAGRRGIKMLTSEISKTNNTTYSDLPGLSLPLLPNAIYSVFARIDYVSTGDATAAATGDIKLAWTAPADTNFLRRCRGLSPTSTDNTSSLTRNSAHNVGTLVNYGTVQGIAYSFVTEDGLVNTGATPGTLQIQGAQWNASASTTVTFKLTSYIRWERVG